MKMHYSIISLIMVGAVYYSLHSSRKADEISVKIGRDGIFHD